MLFYLEETPENLNLSMVFFLRLTWESQGKSANSAGKNAYKILKLPGLKVICWKLTKILILLLIKTEKFYRCLCSGRGTIQQKAVNFSRNFTELYLFPLKTYLFQTWQFYQFKGVLSGSVNRVSLTVPCQKLKKP